MDISKLYLDTETYSSRSLTDGVAAYAAAPSACVMLISWCLQDGPARVVDLTVPDTALPLQLQRALQDPAVEIWAHNALFDRTMLRECAGIAPPLERWRCTMAQAYSHSLPGSLMGLLDVLDLTSSAQQKNAAYQLMRLFCVQTPGKPRNTSLTHPEQWQAFIEYSRQDVVALRNVHKLMPAYNYPNQPELDVWLTDQRSNDYGILLDTDLIDGVLTATVATTDIINTQLAEQSGGAVTSVNQRDRLLLYLLTQYDIQLPNLTANTLRATLLRDDIPVDVQRLLELRAQGAHSSVAKYRTAQRVKSPDNRVRHTLQYCGASRTGRFAGRLLQPQNFPRPSLPRPTLDAYVEAFKRPGAIAALTDNVIEAASECARGMLIPTPGCKLAILDYSAIESRVLAWLAGAASKLQDYRDCDTHAGPDIYCLVYAQAFGLADIASITPAQRHVGKIMELALGFGGGVGALASMALTTGLDLDELARTTHDALQTSKGGWAYGKGWVTNWAYAQAQDKTYGLSRQTYAVCDAIKQLWRLANPTIVNLWQRMEAAVASAARTSPITLGQLKIDYQAPYTRIRLPSGRYLCYHSVEYHQTALQFKGVNPKAKRWGTIETYGGKLVENITQAVARDVLAYHLPQLAALGTLVMSSHDEVVVEVPMDTSLQDLRDAMLTPLDWAAGLPLNLTATEGLRYHK